MGRFLTWLSGSHDLPDPILPPRQWPPPRPLHNQPPPRPIAPPRYTPHYSLPLMKIMLIKEKAMIEARDDASRAHYAAVEAHRDYEQALHDLESEND